MNITGKITRALLRAKPEFTIINSGDVRTARRTATFEHEGRTQAITLLLTHKLSFPADEQRGFVRSDVSEDGTFIVWDTPNQSSGTHVSTMSLSEVFPGFEGGIAVVAMLADLREMVQFSDHELWLATQRRKEAYAYFREQFGFRT